jgi:hypothetical protein
VQLHQKHNDEGLEIITLNMEGEAFLDKARAVIQRLDVGVTNFCLAEAMTDEGLAAVQHESGILPAINLYDRKGRLRHHFEGEINDDEVEQMLSELLSE